jgi:AraC family transcriptional regulator
MAYVRGRRLSRSLSDLINTDLNIIDIANEYQFEHEQSYIRAFKQQFNMTPAQYRKAQCELTIEQKIDINHMHTIGQGLVIQPRMCIQPQFYVQGIEKEIVHKENLIKHTTNSLAEQFREFYLPSIPNKINEQVYIGLVIYSDNPKYSNKYIPCVETRSINKIQAPFVNYTIPLREYAVFRYIGFHAAHNISYGTLKQLYDYIKGEWQNVSAYKQSEPFHFEKMDLKICSESYCEMDVYIPISVEC